MEVLKRAPAFKGLNLSCTCGAELLASLSDFVRISGSDQREGSSWDYCLATCPECDQRLKVETNKFPAPFRGKIRRDNE